jgi:hypothetical protein
MIRLKLAANRRPGRQAEQSAEVLLRKMQAALTSRFA